jgi:hypothetical protein
MFKLQNLNVFRIVDSEHDRDALVGQGYKLVQGSPAVKSAGQPEKRGPGRPPVKK